MRIFLRYTKIFHVFYINGQLFHSLKIESFPHNIDFFNLNDREMTKCKIDLIYKFYVETNSYEQSTY